MNNKYDISIVIPLYNAEKEIKKCIDSIINQSFGFENIELILVDDKSTDNTRNIMKEYEKKYSNCKCIYLKENSGSPSLPRNTGINNATGKYLMFADQDDKITKNCCEVVFKIAEKEKTDIIHFHEARKRLDGIYIGKNNTKINQDYQIIKNKEDRLKLRFTMWGNLFLTSFIKEKNIKVPSTLYEDGVFAIKAYILADKFVRMDNYYGYIYTIEKETDESITHNITLNRCISFLEGFKICNKLIIKNNLEEYKSEVFNILIPMLYFSFFKLNESKENKLNVLKSYQKFFKSLNCPTKLRSKPLDMIHQAVLKGDFKKAIFYSKCASLIYNNKTIKNFIFKLYSNVEKVELE